MSDEQKPRSAWRKAGRFASYPARAYGRTARDFFGPGQVMAEAQKIRHLWRGLRAPRPQAAEIVTDAHGFIDAVATAEVAGLSVLQVDLLLALRLRRTADAFWASLAVSGLVTAAWLAAVWLAPGSIGIWSGSLTALALLSLGLHGLQAAVHNWQIRAMRTGSLGEFLAAGDPLPRRRRSVAFD